MNVRERLLADAKCFREEYDSGGHVDTDGAERTARCLEDAAARIAELEGALRGISDQLVGAHDGGCIHPIRDILHEAGFKQWDDAEDSENG